MIHLSLSSSAFNGSERLGGTGVHKGEDNVLMKRKKKKKAGCIISVKWPKSPSPTHSCVTKTGPERK